MLSCRLARRDFSKIFKGTRGLPPPLDNPRCTVGVGAGAAAKKNAIFVGNFWTLIFFKKGLRGQKCGGEGRAFE